MTLYLCDRWWSLEFIKQIANLEKGVRWLVGRTIWKLRCTFFFPCLNRSCKHAHFVSQFGLRDSTVESYYFQILEYLREYMNWWTINFSPQKNVIWIFMFAWSWNACTNSNLKCMHKSDQWVCIKLYTQWLTLHKHNCREAADQHIITNRRLRLPITKQTFTKNLEYVIDDWTQWQAR